MNKRINHTSRMELKPRKKLVHAKRCTLPVSPLVRIESPKCLWCWIFIEPVVAFSTIVFLWSMDSKGKYIISIRSWKQGQLLRRSLCSRLINHGSPRRQITCCFQPLNSVSGRGSMVCLMTMLPPQRVTTIKNTSFCSMSLCPKLSIYIGS